MAEKEERQRSRATEQGSIAKEREKLIAEAQAEADRIRKQAEADRDAAAATIREQLQKSPFAALQSLGVDVSKLMADAARGDDPAYQQQRAIELELAKEREARKKLEERIDSRDQRDTAAEEARKQQLLDEARRNAEKQVLDLVAARKDKDQIREMFGKRDRSFLASAHDAANEYHEQFGVWPNVETVVKFMALQAHEARGTNAAQGEPAKSNGNAPKDQAKPTTLGAKDASTARAGIRRFDDLPEEEQRRELEAAVAEAMRQA